jgi:hypothetical protein
MMPEGTPLGNEIDRLQVEVAMLTKALEILAKQAERDTCLPIVSWEPLKEWDSKFEMCKKYNHDCVACLTSWAMEKAKP